MLTCSWLTCNQTPLITQVFNQKASRLLNPLIVWWMLHFYILYFFILQIKMFFSVHPTAPARHCCPSPSDKFNLFTKVVCNKRVHYISEFNNFIFIREEFNRIVCFIIQHTGLWILQCTKEINPNADTQLLFSKIYDWSPWEKLWMEKKEATTNHHTHKHSLTKLMNNAKGGTKWRG